MRGCPDKVVWVEAVRNIGQKRMSCVGSKKESSVCAGTAAGGSG